MLKQAEIELLERYIDGKLAEGEVERLQTLLRENAEARRVLRSLATVEFGLQDLAAGAPAGQQRGECEERLSPHRSLMAVARQSAPRYSRMLLALAALVIISLVAGVYVQRVRFQRRLANASAKTERVVAKIAGVGGVVLWTGDGGRVTNDLAVGAELTGGTIEGASPTSWIELEFLDGSRVTVSGDSRLTFSDFGQKVLHLKKGSLASSVRPQSAPPMLVHTRTATLEVLGTEFNVESEIDATSLNVTEGTVRLKRLSDGRTVDVPARRRLVAASGSELVTQPIPESVSQWQSQLQFRPDRVLGKWIPKTDADVASLRLVPYLHTTPQGQAVTVFAAGLQVSSGDDAIVVLRSDSRLRVRGRLRQAQVVYFGVTVRLSDGRYGGSFMTHDSALAPDSERRFEVVLNARDLRLDPALAASRRDLAPSAIDTIVDGFWCSTPTNAAELEIVEVEIFRPHDESTALRGGDAVSENEF